MSWKPRSDDIFFPAMSVLILAVVVFGFAQSYFLPGLVFAKLPNALVHIHGALFVSWIFLLVLQNFLVAVRKIKWHITLGAFLRDYVLSAGAGDGLFTIVSRPAAEKLLRLPHRDPVTVWALATLAALSSGDWLNARDQTGQTFAIPVPG